MLLGIDKYGAPLLNQLSVGVVRQLAFPGRLKVPAAGWVTGTGKDLRLIFHSDLVCQHREGQRN
jgi:hypothetical protein